MKTLKWGKASDYLRWYVLFVCGACLYWNENRSWNSGRNRCALIHVLPSESMWTSDVDLWDDRLFPRFTP